MCNQAVGLIAAALERAGIATAAISLLRFVAQRLGPPRSLWVDRPHGFPLGEPGDHAEQTRTLEALLALLDHRGPPPVLVDH